MERKEVRESNGYSEPLNKIVLMCFTFIPSSKQLLFGGENVQGKVSLRD